MIERIGHINIQTPRLEETLAFYEGLFDLVRGPAATMADQERNAWLYDHDGRAIVHVNMPAADEPERAGSSALDHIAFDCRDPDTMAARLEQRGIAYRRRDTRVAGLVQITLTDPNGIKLELAFGTECARNPSLARTATAPA